jgi:hypothetical protein
VADAALLLRSTIAASFKFASHPNPPHPLPSMYVYAALLAVTGR